MKRIPHALNEHELIRLHHDLVAPVAVHEIVHGHDTLDETARYTLDVMIAEFQPDTALLCIALCAAHVADMHAGYLPIAGSLGFECSRIVHEYGPLWIANADQRLNRSHEKEVLDLLEQMPEDFEALADILGALRSHLIETSDSAILCDILSQNAGAFVDFLEQQAEEELRRSRGHKRQAAATLDAHDNVIVFPRSQRTH